MIYMCYFWSFLNDKKKKIEMNEAWYDIFMEMLYKKYPKKNQLTEALMDLLCLEREAVYRRLRKDVVFPASEIMKIATEWHISLDEITGAASSKISFSMHPINYLAPSEEDMAFVQKRLKFLKNIEKISYSEFISVSNTVSRSMSAGFPQLYKFNIFKWAYQYGDGQDNIPYSQIIVPEKLLEEVAIYAQQMKHLTNTCYILDEKIFENVIEEIRFFHSILLITDEEKELIKQDLYGLLDYLHEIANAGCFPETKNKVQIYISMFNLSTNYSYFCYDETEVCRIHTFLLYDNICYNAQMIEKFKMWMQKKKRTSFKISEVDEKSRIEFYMERRRLIDEL